MGYVALGVSTKREAEKLKRKALNDGFKGIRIVPYISYGQKRPNHYDIYYESVNPLKKKVIRDNKKEKVVGWFRKTPKGMKLVGKDIYRR